MTTIAWDGKTLAADSLGDQNGLRMPTTKLHRGVLADGTPFIMGCAGETSWGRMLHEWAKTLDLLTIDKQRYPYQVGAGEERNDPHGIIVLGGGHGVYYKIGPLFIRLERKFHAIGSGRDYAIAALHLGKDAKEAVEVAIEFDCYSGGAIQTMGVRK